MLYLLLNCVLITLNGNHVIMKIQVRKHLSIIINIPIWYGVRIHLTVNILNNFYQFLIKRKIMCFIHKLSNHINKPFQVFPMITVVYCVCVNVLWLCLWFNMFLAYGDVFTCISPCQQASHILIRNDISGMPLTHSIDNINRVAKCFINHPICKHEQNTIPLYIKIMKYLKKVAYQNRHNARNRYNFTSIILFIYNLIINILLIAIKFSNKKRSVNLITV